MDVAAYFDWTVQLEEDWLLHKDLGRFDAESGDLLLGKREGGFGFGRFVLEKAGDDRVDVGIGRFSVHIYRLLFFW